MLEIFFSVCFVLFTILKKFFNTLSLPLLINILCSQKSVPKSLDTGVGIWNLDAKPVSTNEQPIVNQTKKSTTQPPPPQQQPQLPKRNSFQRLFNTGNKQASVSNPQLPNSSSATSLSQAGSPAEAQPTKVSNPADNIENILKKYSNKTSVSSTQSASQLTVSAPVINEGILIGKD